MTKQHHAPNNLENASEFRVFVYELTESKMFGASVLFVILLNTVILVVQTDEEISVKGGNVSEESLSNAFYVSY